MDKISKVKIVGSSSHFSFDDFKIKTFYESVLSIVDVLIDSDTDSFSIQTLVEKFGDTSFAVVMYLESNAIVKKVSTIHHLGKITFQKSNLKALRPLLKLKIKELRIVSIITLITIIISFASLIVSIIALTLVN